MGVLQALSHSRGCHKGGLEETSPAAQPSWPAWKESADSDQVLRWVSVYMPPLKLNLLTAACIVWNAVKLLLLISTECLSSAECLKCKFCHTVGSSLLVSTECLIALLHCNQVLPHCRDTVGTWESLDHGCILSQVQLAARAPKHSTKCSNHWLGLDD